MLTVTTPSELQAALASFRAANERIALVPTMGNLHPGHLSLVEIAQAHADRVVATIFVNPKQFAAHEDLDSYPRTLEDDLQHLEAAGTDLAFTPTVEDIYPQGIVAHTSISVPQLTDVLCGASRPGHFDGVTTIVGKLLSMTQPQVAVFGEKDLQQLLVIRKMVSDLGMPITIVGAPIARADDGLALSSRNSYLSAQERPIAPQLHSVLAQLADNIQAKTESHEALLADAKQQLVDAGFRVDYLEIRRRHDLQVASADDCEIAIFAAAFLGTTRLIDNLQLTLSAPLADQ